MQIRHRGQMARGRTAAERKGAGCARRERGGSSGGAGAGEQPAGGRDDAPTSPLDHNFQIRGHGDVRKARWVISFFLGWRCFTAHEVGPIGISQAVRKELTCQWASGAAPALEASAGQDARQRCQSPGPFCDQARSVFCFWRPAAWRGLRNRCVFEALLCVLRENAVAAV